MNKTISLICAATLTACTFMPIIPKSTVIAADNISFVSEQLDMPIIAIDTLGSSVSSKESYTTANVTIWNENGDIDTVETEVQIRLRGNVTLNSPKKSYKFKFDKKQNPLSLGDGAGKSWNLVANYFDTSLLRNMTAYHLGDMFDNIPYSANSRSVEVYVNGSYQGVYLFCEAVNVNKNRIAVTEAPDEVENNGYLVEMTRYDCDYPFEIEYAQYDIKSDLSADSDIQSQQKAYISNYMEQCLNALKEGDKTRAETLIDIPSLVDNFIANEICKNVDSGWDSYYLCKDAGGKLQFAPMWDYDLALGNFVDVKGYDTPEGMGIYNVANSNANSNPWFCHALQNDWFREAVAERWDEMYEEVKALPTFVTDEAQENARSYDRNFTKWNNIGKKVFSEPDSIVNLTSYQAHAEYLSNWLDQRIQWLDGYFASDDFSNGVFLDENGKPVDVENAVAVSTLMFWGGTGEIDVDSPGFTADATSAAWGGQALSTGLMLREGQKYRLSFDVSGPTTATVNYRIQANHDNYKVYMSGSTPVSADVTHFETEFTADVTDFNCALVLEFKGSGTVKVEHLSLVEVKEAQLVQGDVNNDGEFSIADIVAFQKWLLAASDAELANWKAADLCEDDKLDVFDLVLMRRLIINITA
ncbi:CotH kinase family protein [Ruminococcus flavefaciens]|uniref:CotH kinase family protein n=1 Tax=Ruminococcus flavefaciens TaxID=1265 RepID=UPI0026F2B80F|nr:CotH kinase family protein [Ruminococcus flavefaciens]